MTNAPLSVLLLAWDDADAAPAEFGAPLPTGAALRAALSTQVRLTAVLPQQPAAQEATSQAARAEPAEIWDSAAEIPAALPVVRLRVSALEGSLASDEGMDAGVPGASVVERIPGPVGDAVAPSAVASPQMQQNPSAQISAPPASASPAVLAARQRERLALAASSLGKLPVPGAPRLIGLADFTMAELAAEARHWGSTTMAKQPAKEGWLVPAAPYIGSSTHPEPEPKQGARPDAAASEARPTSATVTGRSREPAVAPEAAAPSSGGGSSDSKTSAGMAAEDAQEQHKIALNLLTALPFKAANDFGGMTDPGPAEAADLNQWEDDLTLVSDVPEPATGALPAALAALRLPALQLSLPEEQAIIETPAPVAPFVPAPAAPLPVPELFPAAAELLAVAPLPFRVIQYARFAAQLMAGGAGFDLIFSAAWPTWLAAVEIRQLTGRPLVLYVAELPSVQAPRQSRGWLLELERQALRRADVVLVPDAAFARKLSESYRLPRPAQALAHPELVPGTVLPVDSPLFAAALLVHLRAAAGGAA
jgi:hypothetical protein